MGLNFETQLSKIGDALNKLIRDIAKSAGDAVAVFVPIPGTDAVVQNLLANFADDAFEAFAKIYEKIPDWLKEWFHNPAKLKEGVMGIYDATVKFVEKTIGNAGEGESFLNQIKSAYGSGVAMILKVSGAGQKVIDWIRTKVPGFIDSAIEALKTVYPLAMGAISAVSVMAKF
jgi:hypothetical protein